MALCSFQRLKNFSELPPLAKPKEEFAVKDFLGFFHPVLSRFDLIARTLNEKFSRLLCILCHPLVTNFSTDKGLFFGLFSSFFVGFLDSRLKHPFLPIFFL
jgi:hypothetical protein